ncbi:hypothetical protein [Anatilimnocola aggregata]|nr:hypothetical protein [Anatilimnocola aggregata]
MRSPIFMEILLMTQCELETAISQATGEDLHEIRRRGFSIVPEFEVDFDSEPSSPQFVDWDALERERRHPDSLVPSGWGF